MLTVYWYDEGMNVVWFRQDQPRDAIDLAITLATVAAGATDAADCEFRGEIAEMFEAHSVTYRGSVVDVARIVADWLSEGGDVAEGSIVIIEREEFTLSSRRDDDGGMVDVDTTRLLFGRDFDRIYAALGQFAASRAVVVRAPLQRSEWSARGQRLMLDPPPDQ
ncbi:MAG: hypothetical protein QOC81_1685 [Thermoanaerobaculia bacterium]|jgi:hypothetical protein|nr:hypothetical protein [Thermoanaerobaculia bacterium]